MRNSSSLPKGKTKTIFSFTQTELNVSQQQAVKGGCSGGDCPGHGEKPPPPPTSAATSTNLLGD